MCVKCLIKSAYSTRPTIKLDRTCLLLHIAFLPTSPRAVSTTPTLAVDEVQPSGKLTMAYRCPPIATAHK
uniref:Secreted protein n=1 Tax=Echinococcus granulosus TaxID=6210 RepID=A0A068WP63_ECHGR|nr:hypothetical protein EgrG_000472400 [Echinococcus granulosus]